MPVSIAARRRRFTTAFAAIILALLHRLPASAGSATGSLAVTASITSNCTVNVSSMPFGAYDPIVANKVAALSVTGSLSLTCNISTPATVSLGNGLYSAFATGTTRAMKDGATDYLSYELYTTNTRTTVWNSINTVPYVGTGSASLLSVYGRIPAAQVKPAAAYADTVAITVAF